MSRNASKVDWMRLLPLSTVAMLGTLVAVLVVVSTALAQPGIGYEWTPGIPNFCVDVYQPGSVCTANDVRLEELRVIQVVTPCNGINSELTAIFEGVVTAQASGSSPNRYDIGVFIATDGGSAQNPAGVCFHSYFAPDLVATPVYGDANGDGVPDVYNMDPAFTGWWDGEIGVVPVDTCGDIEQATQMIARFPVPLTIACVDQDGDGRVDVGVCTSWDNNTNTECTTVSQAFPGTKSKCSCLRLNLPTTITAVDLAGFSAAAQKNGVLLTWETATELDNLGFKVYRAGSMNGARAQLNQRLIASQMPGSTVGATYTFLDEMAVPGVRYYYWLEDVDVQGLTTRHGPVTAKLASNKTLPGRQRPAPIRLRASR